jgi:hypothetical protein
LRIALDKNELAYVEGINGTKRRKAAPALIRRLSQETTVVPVQVLGDGVGSRSHDGPSAANMGCGRLSAASQSGCCLLLF